MKETRQKRYQKHNTELKEEQHIKNIEKKEKTKNEKKEKINEEKIIEKNHHIHIPKFIIYFILFIILFFIYISLIEPQIITVHEYKISSNKLVDSQHGLKIIQFSDLNYGTTISKKQLQKIIKKINELNPDIIFFTGDLINKNISTTEKLKDELINELKNLNPKLYKYAIYGDDDLKNEYYEEIMKSSNFVVLNNQITPIYYQSEKPIIVIGFNDSSTDPNYSITQNKFENYSSNDLLKIVLIHKPDEISNFIDSNPDLIFAGHSLGGTIKLPFLKPLFLEKGSTTYYNQSYIIDNTNLYISNGLGTKDLKVRFNNYPSFNLFRLYYTE